jgi:aminobenzoyl-glutamate transport protein
LEQYKKEGDPEVGVGTVISMAMPYTIYYLIGFTALLVVWYFAGWALGPGVPLFL